MPGPKQCSRSRASGCSAVRYGPMRRPEQAPGPGLGRRHPPDLRERAVPGLVRRPAEERGVLLCCPARPSWTRPSRHDPQPAAEDARRAVRARRPRHVLEQHPDRVRAQFPAPARQRGDVRLLPPPALPRVDPAVRVQLPGQQVRAAPLVVQAVRQLGHHLPVPAVPAPEQPQGQHEIRHQPRRQQPAPLLPRPRHLDDLIDQLRRERPGQHTDRDPVRQPPVRRQPLSTIMSHKTVTLSHQALRQGHCADGPPGYGRTGRFLKALVGGPKRHSLRRGWRGRLQATRSHRRYLRACSPALSSPATTVRVTGAFGPIAARTLTTQMISSAVCGLTMLPFRTAAAPAAATATAAGSVWLSVPLGDPDGDVSPPQ